MKTYGLSTLLIVASVLLASCGGNDPSSPGMSLNAQSKQLARSTKDATSDYQSEVESLYIAYFGRPGDPAGVAYWAGQLQNGYPLTNTGESFSLNAVYMASIPGLTVSQGQPVFNTTSADAVVTNFYANLFGTVPSTAGLNYWAGQLLDGSENINNLGAAIVASGQVLGSATLANKIAVANNFTAALANTGEVLAYSGSDADTSAHTMLMTVNSTTDVNAFQTTVASTVGTLVSMKFAAIQGIVTQRCVPCHSSNPTEPGYSSAPLGYMYDTAAEIAQYAPLMYEYAVQTTLMPYGNATGMTTAERSTFGAWYMAGSLQTSGSTPAPVATPVSNPTLPPLQPTEPVLSW